MSREETSSPILSGMATGRHRTLISRRIWSSIPPFSFTPSGTPATSTGTSTSIGRSIEIARKSA